MIRFELDFKLLDNVDTFSHIDSCKHQTQRDRTWPWPESESLLPRQRGCGAGAID